MVMTSMVFPHEFGVGFQTYYGVQVTIGDDRMADGRGLETVGVTPDEMLLPTPADLAAARDPVLARAVSIRAER